MTDTTSQPPLSAAALAVMLAATNGKYQWIINDPIYRQCIAAALRAAVAATQMRQYGDCWICDADELLAIAAELENAS